jgi:hypothetical protein
MWIPRLYEEKRVGEQGKKTGHLKPWNDQVEAVADRKRGACDEVSEDGIAE